VSRNLNVIRANAYAASTEVTSCTAITPTAMMHVLR
jgi:hypothetical protein